MGGSLSNGEVGITALESPHLRFRSALGEGRLIFQLCDACCDAIFPPRVVCPACGSTALTATTSAGFGTVYSTTVVSQRDADAYSLSLIELDEGFRMMSTVVGTPAADVPIGARVRLAVEMGDTPRATFLLEESA